MNMGINFLLKEQELDFSETKSVFLDIIHGNISPDINLKDILSPDNFMKYTVNFFKFLYRGLPKLNEFTIDLKQTIKEQIKGIFFNMNKDMTFIISKNLLDFLRKYQSL